MRVEFKAEVHNTAAIRAKQTIQRGNTHRYKEIETVKSGKQKHRRLVYRLRPDTGGTSRLLQIHCHNKSFKHP